MVAIKMSNAPVVVAETTLTLSSGTPLGWVCIRRKNSSAYEERPNSGQCGKQINNGTYSDLVYDTFHGPQRNIDNQNGHGCDDRYGADWRQSTTMKWPQNAIAHSVEGMGNLGQRFDQLGPCGCGR